MCVCVLVTSVSCAKTVELIGLWTRGGPRNCVLVGGAIGWGTFEAEMLGVLGGRYTQTDSNEGSPRV